MDASELPPVNIAAMKEGLTFDELDQVEAMTGLALADLETKAQSKLTRAMLIIGWARAGHVVAWDSLSNLSPTDFITDEEVSEDPTETVSSN